MASMPTRSPGPTSLTMRRSPSALLRSSRTTPERTVNAARPLLPAVYSDAPASRWMSAI
jgi:hypothetical protein